jgi:hypothetical protein
VLVARASRRWWMAAAASVLLLAACSSVSAPVRVVPLSSSGARAVPTIEGIDEYPEAVNAILSVLERDIGLPALDGSVFLFRDRAGFEAGLVERGYPPAFARQTASVLDAIGGPGIVLVNGAALDRLAWPDRVRMLAHELTHTAQYRLAGGRRGASDQWLREGFADWASARVMERLGASSIDADRRRSRQTIRRARRLRPFPTLEEMATFQQWVALAGRRPRLPLYELAFLATDLLLRRSSAQTLVTYFRLFADSADRPGSFRRAFGLELGEFEREFDADLERLAR